MRRSSGPILVSLCLLLTAAVWLVIEKPAGVAPSSVAPLHIHSVRGQPNPGGSDQKDGLQAHSVRPDSFRHSVQEKGAQGPLSSQCSEVLSNGGGDPGWCYEEPAEDSNHEVLEGFSESAGDPGWFYAEPEQLQDFDSGALEFEGMPMTADHVSNGQVTIGSEIDEWSVDRFGAAYQEPNRVSNAMTRTKDGGLAI